MRSTPTFSSRLSMIKSNFVRLATRREIHQSNEPAALEISADVSEVIHALDVRSL